MLGAAWHCLLGCLALQVFYDLLIPASGPGSDSAWVEIVVKEVSAPLVCSQNSLSALC